VILEGIVTTIDTNGRLNVAPMGPRIDSNDWSRFTLRPFKTSTTYTNLNATHAGVFHIIDDALLLARTAIGHEPHVETIAAQEIAGRVIASACRAYEFRAVAFDDRDNRTTIEVETRHIWRFRDFIGWNRARHAILELAILCTRVHLITHAEILSEFARMRAPIEKTGAPGEMQAYELLYEYVISHGQSQPDAAGGSG
jgi:hypothetical protein